METADLIRKVVPYNFLRNLIALSFTPYDNLTSPRAGRILS